MPYCLEIYIKTNKGEDNKEEFENAGVEYYRTESNKQRRIIVAKIIRMEL